MHVVMDADCLIKLTKAGLKERICAVWSITIPDLVQRETTEWAPHLPDAVRIRENVVKRRLSVKDVRDVQVKGEDAVLHLFREGGFDAVASDDARFVRRLRGLGVPFVVPAVVVVLLRKERVMSAQQAGEAVEELRPHISADQYASAQLLLSGGEAR